MEDKKLNIQVVENDFSLCTFDENLCDTNSKLCESSCFKAVQQLLEHSDQRAELEEFIYMVHMKDNQLTDLTDKVSDQEVKLSVYKQQVQDKSSLIDTLNRKIHKLRAEQDTYLYMARSGSEQAAINVKGTKVTEVDKMYAETIKAKDELIETLKESLELSKDHRKLCENKQLSMTTKIDNLLAQQATTNEDQIKKDNEIAQLKSKINTNEMQVNEKITIINELKVRIAELKTDIKRQENKENSLLKIKDKIDELLKYQLDHERFIEVRNEVTSQINELKTIICNGRQDRIDNDVKMDDKLHRKIQKNGMQINEKDRKIRYRDQDKCNENELRKMNDAALLVMWRQNYEQWVKLVQEQKNTPARLDTKFKNT